MNTQTLEVVKQLPPRLQHEVLNTATLNFFVEEAGLYELIVELCLKNGVESKSHFLEVLQDNVDAIYEKFDKITESLGE